MRSWLASLLLLVLSTPFLAQAAYAQTSTTTTTTTTTTKKAGTTAKKPTAKTPAATTTAKKPSVAGCCGDIKTLRDAVSAQQQQIQMLRDELQRRDAAMQQVQQQLNSLQSAAQQAQQAAQSAQSSSKANEDALAALKTNVSTVETSASATANSLQGTEKRVTALESPLAIKYKGITITPGGFISANINFRNHNQNLDNFGSFGAIPFSGSSNGHLTEFRASGRYSRISLLAEGKTKGFNAQAYYEMDFEGAAQTGNENQTNSYQPRIRELWANVDAPHGLSFSAGQEWSAITANRTGIGPRGKMLPAHISASLVVGWHYTRQGAFNVYKTWNFANNKKLYWIGSVENSETTSTGTIPTGFTIIGTQGSSPISAGGGTNCSNAPVAGPTVNGVTSTGLAPCSTLASNTSIDMAPDFITKVALEPGWGHFEVGGMIRFFRDRIYTTLTAPVGGSPNAGTNKFREGFGITANALLPVVPKKVDIVLTTLGGRGIGRYTTTGIADVTFRPDGTFEPLLAYTGTAGVEMHPTPKFDFDVYFGAEYVQKSPYFNAARTAVVSGYASPFAVLNGCQVEIPINTATNTCGAANRSVWQATPGFWYRFYRGPAGTIQYGMFYSYFRRNLWTGNLTSNTPNADLHEILTAFRWYFP